MRTRSGLPKHCSWNIDRHGRRRVRFRKGGFTTYLTGTPWSEDFMRQHAAAADGVKAQARNIGAARTVAGTVNALVAAYLDPRSSSPFKTAAAETQRTRRNILENFRKAYGDKPVFRTDNSGRRTMLLTREHVQRIVNEKAATPFAQRNFLNTLRAMFKWAAKEGRIPDDPTLGVIRARRSRLRATRHGRKSTSGASKPSIPSAPRRGSPSLSCFTPDSDAATW
jgi:hypothetical protein